MPSELVERLRSLRDRVCVPDGEGQVYATLTEAADRIEELEGAGSALLDAIAFLSLRDELGHERGGQSMNEGWETTRKAAEKLDALLNASKKGEQDAE